MSSRSTIDGRVRGVGGRRREPTGPLDAKPAESAAAKGRKKSRRGKPRYELQTAGRDPARFLIYFDAAVSTQPAKALDVSAEGLALELASESLRVGQSYRVRALVDGRTHSLLLKIVNRRGKVVGCRVLDADAGWKERVSFALDPVSVGIQVRELPEEHHADGTTKRWLHGPAFDYWAWLDKGGALQRVQGLYLGVMLEWSPTLGLRTGRSRTLTPGALVDASMLFVPDRGVSEETVEAFRSVLERAQVDAVLTRGVFPA